MVYKFCVLGFDVQSKPKPSLSCEGLDFASGWKASVCTTRLADAHALLNWFLNKQAKTNTAAGLLLEWFAVGSCEWTLLVHPISIGAQAINWFVCSKHKHSLIYGAFASCVLVVLAIGFGSFLNFKLGCAVLAHCFEPLIVATLFGHRSLLDHVDSVLNRVYSTDLDLGRQKLAMIVGRDVAVASESEVCSAVVLSLVENFCDATFSPLLFYLLWGLPGLMAYKVVDLADSLFGSLKSTSGAIGIWLAMLDDVFSYIPSRILGLLFVTTFCAVGFGSRSFEVYKDGHSLVSLNCGLCAAAAASHLEVRIGGSRCYKGVLIKDRQFNALARCANGLDVRRAQLAVNLVCLVLAAASAVLL
ncbi:MAG: cobalamin biosynthesis protein [Candidatus Hodgkinia cicadicola]|nr:MAG: cobalamin biosynthesis protein [Candidatus Hodgkinia cicadicola]